MRRLISAPNLALATLWADMLTHGGIEATGAARGVGDG
jgi:hypothetical protein